MSASPTPSALIACAALDEGERAQPVAQHGGKLEIHRLGRLLHLTGELLLHLRRLAGEEGLRVLDQLGIVVLARSGRRTAPSSA